MFDGNRYIASDSRIAPRGACMTCIGSAHGFCITLTMTQRIGAARRLAPVALSQASLSNA
jgi:hypothetical protein